MPSQSNDLNAVIRQLAVQDISSVAESLGMQVYRKPGSTESKALCPFHSDTKPSLVLYTAELPHYHCYVCGAHGDVFDLVKEQRNLGFIEASQWLADWAHVPWPHTYLPPRVSGYCAAQSIYLEAASLKTYAEWATSRGYDPEFLRSSCVGYTSGGKLLATIKKSHDRLLLDAFLDAGLVRRGSKQSKSGAESHDAWHLPLDDAYDYFWGKRVIFSIDDTHGNIAGFAGRAVDNAEPKYLYTKGLRKSDLLYRYQAAERNLVESAPDASQCVHLFVVEGLMDALRLESFGMAAVALLGARASQQQIELVVDLARKSEKKGASLAVHVFLDADTAGRNGALRLLPELLCTAAGKDIQLFVDAIVPADVTGVLVPEADPDAFLKDLTAGDATTALARSAIPAISYLVAGLLDCGVGEIEAVWTGLPALAKHGLLRRIELLFDDRDTALAILKRNAVQTTAIGNRNDTGKPWVEAFKSRLLFPDRPKEEQGQQAVGLSGMRMSNYSALRHALNIARTSSQRRELPTDSNGWHQLDIAADIALPHLAGLLNTGEGANESPMMAYPVPRLDGDFRKKAVPPNEVLLMQQYLLNELLTPRDDLPTFEAAIPAVRRRRGHGRATTTGQVRPSKTVSFAYQIDMDALEGRIPPKSSGMFVHYFDCWHDFVGYVDELVSEVLERRDQVFMSRLDIRRYYDNLPRHAVHDVLRRCTRDVFTLASDKSLPLVADLFRPSEKDAYSRANGVIDWLCNSSFGYRYYSFSDAEIEVSPSDRGVPQGPDLSAYLANIALFPLDKAVCDRIEELGSVGGYARYVDDLVLVADSRERLAAVTSLIESQLQKLGLELNRKHQQLPGMTRSEAREWVTDQRGGLGASILGELPFIQGSDATSDFLEVSEPIDRREALLVLANPELFDREFSEEEAENLLAKASKARDLRYGELVRICAWIWWFSVRDDSDDVDLGISYKQRLAEVLSRPPAGLSGKEHAQYWESTRLLASLEGLERLLCARADRAPGFDSVDKKAISAGRRRLAKWVLTDGAFASISALATSPKAEDNVRHATRLRKLCLLREATVLLNGDQKPSLSLLNAVVGARQRTANEIAQLRHLAAVGCQVALTQIRDQPDTAALGLMHECVARLRAKDAPQSGDRLDPVAKPISEVREQLGPESSAADLLFQLSLWLPSFSIESEYSPKLLHAACLSFLNCTSIDEAADLLSRRTALSKCVLGEKVTCIPVPSGTSFPGLLGHDADRFIRADFAGSTEITGDLQWVDVENVSTGLPLRKETLNSGWCISDAIEESLAPEHCLKAVKMFRDVWNVVSDSASDGETVVPYLGNVIVRGSDTAILTYKLNRENVGNAAFVRIPHDGLVSREVPKEFADVWRTGVAIADCFGFGCEGLSDDDIRLTAKALVGNADSWPTETMLRIAFSRLTGRSAAGYALRQESGTDLPRTVERMLERMQDFGAADSTLHSQMSVLCAALVDLRACRLRLRRQFESIEAPGAACHFLSIVAGQFFGHDEVFSEHLPTFVDAGDLRSESVVARGWFQIGARVQQLAPVEVGLRRELDLLAAGCCVQAIATEFRVISLALAKLISPQARDSIEKQLVRALPVDSEIDISESAIATMGIDDNRQVLNRLFACLFFGDSADILVSVTPLGWAVAAGLLGGIVGDLKGSAPPVKPERKTKTRDLLLQTIRALGVATDDSEFPFGDAKVLCNSLTRGTLGAAMDASRSLMDMFEIRLTTKKDRSFSLPGGRTREARARLGTVEFSLHRGQVISQQLPRERSSAPWATAGTDDDGAHLQMWSEVEAQGRIAGIEVWSQAFSTLAQLAGDSATEEPEPDSQRRAEDECSPPEVASQPSRTAEPEHAQQPEPAVSKPSSSSDNHDRCLENLQKDQSDAWKSRKKTVNSHLRVAFCQLRVEHHSYQHPLYDVATKDLGSSGVDYHTKPWLWDKVASDKKYGKAPSSAEGRRRRILAEVIKACDEFGVEVLLLPEYSVRPETVIWLQEHLTQRDSQLAVWAGTFRNPPHMVIAGQSWVDKLGNWNSVLPVVLRKSKDESYKIYTSRKKRYGSVAANEWFNPSGSGSLNCVSDVLELDPAKDLRAVLIELICSEVFMASSPSNLHSLAEYRRRMLAQLGLNSGEDLGNMIMEDVKWFAESTALTRTGEMELQRKSIVLIPAYTTRATDYAVFGQASYLSSGLVSVFCDAVSSGGGRGCSCFIGDNSWDDESDHNGHKQRIGRYHGVFPGMYRQWEKERGWLGTQEQALVIADIDPVNTVPGKPRQQTLLDPMELVAHLPIIEYDDNRRRAATVARIAREIHQLPQSARQRSDQLGSEDVISVSSPLGHLAWLGRTEKGEGWLDKRCKAFIEQHGGLPHAWPFPCLIDWLPIPVEIDKREHLLATDDELPFIHVPPYSALGPGKFGEKGAV